MFSCRRALARSTGVDQVSNWHDQLFFAKEFDTRAAVETSLDMLKDLQVSMTEPNIRSDGGA